MGNSLVTLAEYKSYTQINSPNQDAEISLLIPKVSQLIKTYCRQTFNDYVDDPKVEQFDGGFVELILKEHPVISVLGVETSIDYGKTYNPLEEYVDFVFSVNDNSVKSLSVYGFGHRINGYKVSYTCGYEQLPEDLKLAAMDLITYYRRNDGAVHSPKAPGTNSVQIEYISTTTLPAHIRRVLDQYVADFT